jgi:hypothetical protein
MPCLSTQLSDLIGRGDASVSYVRVDERNA